MSTRALAMVTGGTGLTTTLLALSGLAGRAGSNLMLAFGAFVAVALCRVPGRVGPR